MPNSHISPQQALNILKEGNFRFFNNMSMNQDLLQQVKKTRYRQEPFAVVVSCMDSRTSAELILDLGIGDIFSIRIAGNVITPGILGSLEYATAAAGARLIVILGHTGCGAIKGACDDVKMGNLTGLLAQIKPAIEQEKTIEENRNGDNEAFVNEVTKLNIRHSMESVLNGSEVIRNLIEEGRVGIVTALYDISNGRMSFFEDEAVMPKNQAAPASQA